ncbi:Ribonucleoside-diphosphate reductase NrdZ [compost metagenome]
MRRGAFAAYLDIDHPDVEEFLNIKNIGHPIQNLFFAVCIPDYWMQEMIDGDMQKREIWAKVLESRQQKGLPYLFFSDNVNRNKPQVYKDLSLQINASNLCSEIALPSTIDESFICCLSSMNLELYDEWKDTEAVKMAIFFLDAVLQEFIVKTEDNYYLAAANRFAKRHRALGLGVLGWHSYLQKNRIPFEGLRAKQLTNEIFKHIHEKSEKATAELSYIYGEPEILKGYGRRNTTLLAIAPTTSSSAILGQCSPGIEPFSSNYYKAGLSKGNFMRKNKYLKALLEEKGLDNEEIWRGIMLNNGSVQHIAELTQQEKDVFKTFKEISQLEIIQQASIRQGFIDQAQSLNLNIPSNMPIKDVNRLMIEAWKLGVKTLYYQRSQSVSKELVNNLVTCSSCES